MLSALATLMFYNTFLFLLSACGEGYFLRDGGAYRQLQTIPRASRRLPAVALYSTIHGSAFLLGQIQVQVQRLASRFVNLVASPPAASSTPSTTNTNNNSSEPPSSLRRRRPIVYEEQGENEGDGGVTSPPPACSSASAPQQHGSDD